MLKIYIYWHKCWCHRCGTDGRTSEDSATQLLICEPLSFAILKYVEAVLRSSAVRTGRQQQILKRGMLFLIWRGLFPFQSWSVWTITIPKGDKNYISPCFLVSRERILLWKSVNKTWSWLDASATPAAAAGNAGSDTPFHQVFQH